MGEHTGISWCDHTFNPWMGCTKVSAGCTNCYAERENKLFQWVDAWGDKGHRKKTSADNWKNPVKWATKAHNEGKHHKVFCASLADVFEDRPELIPWRSELFELIENTPDLDWLLLTKRPENIRPMFYRQWGSYEEDIICPDNIWMGVTTENQEMFDKRIPILLDTPTATKFISVEPMLGPINILDPVIERIDWVICGGESGPNARPIEREWIYGLQEQCDWSNTPFFFKQMGGNHKIDGHWGGDLLDGAQYHEFPKGA